jgi:hypothetical protein
MPCLKAVSSLGIYSHGVASSQSAHGDIDESFWLHKRSPTTIKDKLDEDEQHVSDGKTGLMLGCLTCDVSLSVLLYISLTLWCLLTIYEQSAKDVQVELGNRNTCERTIWHLSHVVCMTFTSLPSTAYTIRFRLVLFVSSHTIAGQTSARRSLRILHRDFLFQQHGNTLSIHFVTTATY